MNQILSTEMKKKKTSSGPADIKKVIKVFCVFLIIFGIAMIGQGSYAIFKNMGTNINKVAGNTNQKDDSLPSVSIDRDGNKIIIKASHNKEIAKITYQWNADTEHTIQGNGSNTLEQTLELPIGNNTLNLKVTDSDGKEISYKKEYVTDATKPQIGIEVNGNKLKITAKDNTALSYITYRWNEGEETKVEAKEESKAQIEQEIDIPKGENNLTVVAVNTNNVSETKTQTVKGITKPKVSVTQDGNFLVISASDEEAIKQVDYTLNGKAYRLDYSTTRETKIEYRQQMVTGENRISLKVTNISGAEENFEGIATYNP